MKKALPALLFAAILLLFVGCGDDGRGSLPSSCGTAGNDSSSAASVSQSVSSQAASSPESLPENSVSSPDSSEISSASEYGPEYGWYSGNPEKDIVMISAGETLTLSDGRMLECGILLPDGRYFSREELEKHHYETYHKSFLLPDGTVLRPTGWLIAVEGELTRREWEELEEKNFPEEERWHILPWDETAYRNRWGIYRKRTAPDCGARPARRKKPTCGNTRRCGDPAQNLRKKQTE